jgi:cytochrome c oxidase assembly protein subunit 15
LNSGFSLNDFKAIFFWEWIHRLWGRLIGFAFLIPFVVFLIQGRFKRKMVRPMVILFLLGALQGAVGWIMVASGLTGDAIYVEPVKLAMHFVLASVLISYTFWFALQLLIRKEALVNAKGLKKNTLIIIAILFIQLIFGALMAGNKAAPAAPTWPDINGSFIPGYVFTPADGWKSIVENAIVIQFIHRSLAYIITAGILWWTFLAFKLKTAGTFKTARSFPGLLVLVQVGLGIFAVLTSTKIKPNDWNIFQWMAVLHQLVAICLLLSLINCFYLLQGQQKPNS